MPDNTEAVNAINEQTANTEIILTNVKDRRNYEQEHYRRTMMAAEEQKKMLLDNNLITSNPNR